MVMPFLPTLPGDLLPPQTVAAILGVSPGTLDAWRSTRRVALPFVKVGALVRYRRSDIEAFIAARVDPGVA